MPLAAWFRTGWLPRLKETLLDPSVREQGFLDQTVVARMIADHAAGRADHSHPLFTLLVFQLWLDEARM